MVAQKSGKILCMGCGFAGSHEAQGWVHYYTANLSIRSFVNGLAAELRPFQVQANCLAPWFVATKPVERHYAEESKEHSGGSGPRGQRRIVVGFP